MEFWISYHFLLNFIPWVLFLDLRPFLESACVQIYKICSKIPFFKSRFYLRKCCFFLRMEMNFVIGLFPWRLIEINCLQYFLIEGFVTFLIWNSNFHLIIWRLIFHLEIENYFYLELQSVVFFVFLIYSSRLFSFLFHWIFRLYCDFHLIIINYLKYNFIN